jgi:hypothetical protein
MEIDVSSCGGDASTTETASLTKTELELASSASGQWQTFNLWMLGHCIRAAGNSDGAASSKACQQLLQLWSDLPVSQRPPVLAAAAQMPKESLMDALALDGDGDLALKLLESAYVQHSFETKTLSKSLLLSTYMCDLLDVGTSAAAWNLLPAVPPPLSLHLSRTYNSVLTDNCICQILWALNTAHQRAGTRDGSRR